MNGSIFDRGLELGSEMTFRGNLESTLRFHKFHESLNKSIKVQVIGLGMLADEIDAGISPTKIQERLYARSGWLWGGMPDLNDPTNLLETTRRDIGQAGLARAFSAFDLFLDELQADVDRWNHFYLTPSKIVDSAENEDSPEVVDRVEKFYARLGADNSNVSHIWDVYQYFRFARDCIVHREGRASDALVTAFANPGINTALNEWVERTDELTAPVLVKVTKGEQIDFTHQQALAASSTLRIIALDLTKIVAQTIGKEGFIYLAAYHAFYGREILPEVAGSSSMLKALNYMLSQRYRVHSFDKTEVSRILKKLGLTKKCSAKFTKIRS
jgi:hypothetical protein